MEVLGRKCKVLQDGKVFTLTQKDLEEMMEENGAPKDVCRAVANARDKIFEASARAAKEEVCKPDCEHKSVAIRIGNRDGAIETRVHGVRESTIPDPDNEGQSKKVKKFGRIDVQWKASVSKEIMSPLAEEVEKDCELAFK